MAELLERLRTLSAVFVMAGLAGKVLLPACLPKVMPWEAEKRDRIMNWLDNFNRFFNWAITFGVIVYLLANLEET